MMDFTKQMQYNYYNADEPFPKKLLGIQVIPGEGVEYSDHNVHGGRGRGHGYYGGVITNVYNGQVINYNQKQYYYQSSTVEYNYVELIYT